MLRPGRRARDRPANRGEGRIGTGKDLCVAALADTSSGLWGRLRKDIRMDQREFELRAAAAAHDHAA